MQKRLTLISDLTGHIKSLCREEGFIKARVSRTVLLEREGIELKQWLEEGRNADMKWMENFYEKRIDSGIIMQEVKSVVSLAYLYDTPFEHKENLPKISRYAWGNKDYHKIIKKKLKRICEKIENISPDIKTKYYVDDGPIMEKAWAVRSGIGWLGKHTNIIEPDYGSFFFLAEIFLNLELNEGEPIEDMCGGCRICIEACPTGAIYEEYKVDANLCISYHTIENKGNIPDYIDLSGWVFGCDVCQDVCPYNKKKFFTEDKNFYPKKILFNSTREELLSLSEAEFNQEFIGTPIKRTKYSGWKRNLNRKG